jgi:hypothetical protein
MQLEKQEQINRNLMMIAQLENELRMAREEQLVQEIKKRKAETIAVQTSLPTINTRGVHMHFGVTESIEIKPEMKHKEVEAKARDSATSPMIYEKSTDPKVQDFSGAAWKRDDHVQTS